MKNEKLIFGVMSGTSLDGIDVVLIKVAKNKITLIDFIHKPYSKSLILTYCSFNSRAMMT
jgi:1,6-anhydro-N-acetylmuramate kinase